MVLVPTFVVAFVISSSGSDSSTSLFGRKFPMKTPPLDKADNGRLFDEAEEHDGFKTPGSLGYWSQGLNIPAKKHVCYTFHYINKSFR